MKIIFAAIILSGTFSLEFKKRTRNILITCGTVAIFLNWLSYFIINDWLKITAFFARSKNVTLTILINSINCYLLIGVLGAVLLAMEEILQKFVLHLDAGGINFAGNGAIGFHDYLYFSFVTMTTLGYGDVTPISSTAKSTTIIIAVAGQLYLTILVAMLVGKFLSKPKLD
ncbi:MAG: two pore domain potassium channel family protein [Deltaproteobacteria bacterium]|nr:two pore domain potassium channel family protein [Deltaproteobacteria bacterium]